MKSHHELTDQEFERQFAACSLDPVLFTHEAHLRLAWLYLHQYGLDPSIQLIREQLKAFVKNIGATDKYNETLTVASMKMVHQFMIASQTNNFLDFIHGNDALRTDFKELLSHHYASDIFTSEEAKVKYLPPELLPFDS